MAPRKTKHSNNGSSNETFYRDDHDLNSYSSLCENSIETCDFCDKVFTNRISSIIHNARHIIIPLFKQNIFECGECLHHFTSQFDLDQHIAVKHIITEFLPKIVLVKTEPKIIKEELNKETKDDWDNKKYLHNGDLKHNSQSHLTDEDGIDINWDIEDGVDIKRDIEDGVDIERDSDIIDIKSRLVFEDDDLAIYQNDLINDLTKNCKVNVESSPWLKLKEHKSVHYDQLILPGLYRCKKCPKSFPSRYESILHETKHMSLDRSQIQFCNLCGKYIQGYLTHHMMREHPLDLKNELSACKKCGMKYNNFVTHSHQECTVTGCKEKSNVIKLCNMCYTFCRNTQNRLHAVVGMLNTLGKMDVCQRCKCSFLNLKLVQISVKLKQESRKSTGKRKTYEDRLKVIKKRLKRMKMCVWCFVYFRSFYCYYAFSNDVEGNLLMNNLL